MTTTNRLGALALSLLLAACSSQGPGGIPADSPPADAPAARAPLLETGPEAGKRAPGFTLPSLSLPGERSLDDALAAAGGRPLVLVLGAASCSISTQQVEEMAAAGLAGPGGDPGILAVVQGTHLEVRGVVPEGASFPVLVDGDGSILTRFRVGATPSIVVLDGSGRIAYIGGGGYIPVPKVREMAAAAARGEAVDPATVKPAAG